MSRLVILAALVFDILCSKSNRQTNGGENLTPTTAVGMGNYGVDPMSKGPSIKDVPRCGRPLMRTSFMDDPLSPNMLPRSQLE